MEDSPLQGFSFCSVVFCYCLCPLRALLEVHLAAMRLLNHANTTCNL